MGAVLGTRQVYGSWLDPRPDLETDAELWAAVLIEAQRSDPYSDDVHSVYGLLHGLRCGGAKLFITDTGNLRLDYNALVAPGLWTNRELRNKWLIPVATTIKRIFAKVERRLQGDVNQEPLFELVAGL